ncbi:MAG: Gfo/Idh/MocA family oxidoreductase [Treponemataceae bacterium]|nr:Gfo/Idh/MocA family oxidoreductase [Treponemataceae bacterium]
MKIYNAAIIGIGRIGFSLGFDKKREQPASHSFALNSNKRIRLVAACDIDESRLNKWQERYKNAVTFKTVEDLISYGRTLKEGRLDIIVVAVNEDSHLECAIKAIQAKPGLVILEKPVALNSQQAFKIKEEAEKFQVPVLVNHERRFAKDYHMARGWMDKIGQIQSINARLFSGLRVYRKEDEESGAYSLLHDGTHLVDIVMYLLEHNKKLPEDLFLGKKGRAKIAEKAIEANEGSEPSLKNARLNSIYFDEEKVVRNLCVNFQHEECNDVNIYISGRSRFFGFEIEVLGTEGRICIGNGYAKVYRRRESKMYSGFYSLQKMRSVKFPRKTGYFSNMVQNAVDFLDGKCSLRSNLNTGIEALLVLEEMKKLILSRENSMN